jgi:hypothetical protein
METIGIVLNIDKAQTEAFEAGFREMEAPTWLELYSGGALVMATLSRLDISTKSVEGAVQYLVVAIFGGSEGHHLHDNHPRFKEWNARADAFQIAEPFVFGGETVVRQGP